MGRDLEHKKEYQKEYYLKNKEKLLEYRKNFYNENKEIAIQRSKTWAENNKRRRKHTYTHTYRHNEVPCRARVGQAMV